MGVNQEFKVLYNLKKNKNGVVRDRGGGRDVIQQLFQVKRALNRYC